MVPLHFLFFRLQMGCLLVLACGSVLGSLTTPMDLAEARPFLVDDGLILLPAPIAPLVACSVIMFLVALGVPLSWEKLSLVRLGFQLGRSSCMGPR